MPNENRPDDDEASDELHADPEHPGSERHADEQRTDDGGPRYHGDQWQKADEEPARGPDEPAEEETAEAAFEANDEQLNDAGTRGAVFGRGGHGKVERDDLRDAPANRDRKLERP
jgi:hypothetical protein